MTHLRKKKEEEKSSCANVVTYLSEWCAPSSSSDAIEECTLVLLEMSLLLSFSHLPSLPYARHTTDHGMLLHCIQLIW